MIYEKIKEYRLNYRKNKHEVGASFFTYIQGEMERVSKQPTDEQALKILKKIKAAVSEQPDTPQKYQEEAMISTLVVEFEPKQLSDTAIADIIKLSKFANVGEAQKYFKTTHPGQYDGSMVTKLYKGE